MFLVSIIFSAPKFIRFLFWLFIEFYYFFKSFSEFYIFFFTFFRFSVLLHANFESDKKGIQQQIIIVLYPGN